MPGDILKGLLICDIDGCLNAGKLAPLDLGSLDFLAGQIRRLREKSWGFTLCTGRPQPYAEFMVQALALDLPLVCESGAMIYDPVGDRTEMLASPENLDQITQMRTFFQANPSVARGLTFEPGKECSLSLTGPQLRGMSHTGIDDLMYAIKAGAPPNDLFWSHSSSAIDLTTKDTNKGSGVLRLLDKLAFKATEAWGIGDSLNDIPFLSVVGRRACPANASPEVKKLADYVARRDNVQGVVEISARFI